MGQKERPNMKRDFSAFMVIFLTAVFILSWTFSAVAEEEKPIKIGVVTFLSGGAAGPFGVPARNGAEVLTEALNAGTVPAPYATKGLGGAAIELVFMDEAGGVTKQVTEYRNLVQRQNVDLVIGYISSGDAIAIPPVAEELKKLTIIFDAGTPRVFEDASYKYVFRTGAHATMDNVAAALYVTELRKKVNKIAGINQNYAWGQDSWNDFEAAMKALDPRSASSRFPDAQIDGRPVQRGDFLSDFERCRSGPLQLLGRRPGSLRSAGGPKGVVQEKHGRPDRRGTGHVPSGQTDA